MPYFWEKAFGQAEVDAAWLLSEKFRGYPKTAILEILGTPDMSGKIPPVVKNTGTAQEQLTYFVGGEKECVMFLFSDPNRAQSRFLGWDESFEISNWITNNVAKNAVGKTYEQIVKENGIAGYVSGRAFEVPPESKNNTFTTSFIFGDTAAVDLEFRHGVCTKASTGAIFH